MTWISRGTRHAVATAELAAERGEDDVLNALTTDTLTRAQHRLVILARQWPKYLPALARIDAVLARRRAAR